MPGSSSYLLLLAYLCEFLPLRSAPCGFSDPIGSSAKQGNISGAASRSTAWEVTAKRELTLLFRTTSLRRLVSGLHQFARMASDSRPRAWTARNRQPGFLLQPRCKLASDAKFNGRLLGRSKSAYISACHLHKKDKTAQIDAIHGGMVIVGSGDGGIVDRINTVPKKRQEGRLKRIRISQSVGPGSAPGFTSRCDAGDLTVALFGTSIAGEVRIKNLAEGFEVFPFKIWL